MSATPGRDPPPASQPHTASHGQVVADGTAAEVKALAAGRTVRATLAGADEAALRAIPGTDSVEVRGETVLIHSTDSDTVGETTPGPPAWQELKTPAVGLVALRLCRTSGGDSVSDSVTNCEPWHRRPGVP